MKKLTLLFLACVTACALHAQHPKKKELKPYPTKVLNLDSAKAPKQYVLQLVLDSVGYKSLQATMGKVYNDIDNSNIPHDAVKADQAFIKQLYTIFDSEKAAQDKPKVEPAKYPKP